MRHVTALAVGATLAVFLCRTASGEEESPGFHLHLDGLLDVRAVETAKEVSFLDGGLGKARYGGDGDSSGTRLRLAQSSAVLRASAGEAFSARVQLNVDSDPHPRSGLKGVDVVEAYAALAPRLSDAVGLRFRAGFFFPPISLENDGPAWSTTRTLTPSAINSWIGEEVRTTGLEASFHAFLPESDLVLTGAIFGWNDPTGSLLAYRGWALHDRASGATDRIPLPGSPGYEPLQDFPKQTDWVAPFREVDGRAGWYAAGSWSVPEKLELRLLRYDNRGDWVSVERGQYAWQTRFWAAGLRAPLGGGLELVAQGMTGRTRMGPGPAIDVTFESAYGLASLELGHSRLSVRFEAFRNEDQKEINEYSEHGNALTAAWLLTVASRHTLVLEVQSIWSVRPARDELGLPPAARETLATLSWRWKI